MNRDELFTYASEQYATEPDYPWASLPTAAVLRHKDKAWYALVMDIRRDKLGLDDDGSIDGVNLKADPDDVALLQMQEGIFPAYHMNKTHWITVALDGSVPDDELLMLLDQSYLLTKKNSKPRN